MNAEVNVKAKVEAVLFLTDKPMRAQGIARVVNADVQVVRQLILELINEYEERGGALEIAQENGYIIEVKPEYASLMEEFFPIEMSAALLRTLSAIAIKQPIMQSEIIRVRGAGAYEHIRELITKELINKKEDGGRSPILTTTKKFQEYFRLTGDGNSLRKYFKKQAQPAEGEEGQLALPLSAEELAKQEQMESVLGQLMEVASEPSGEDDLPPAIDAPESPALMVVPAVDETDSADNENSDEAPLLVLPSAEDTTPTSESSEVPPLVVVPSEPASNGEPN